MVLDGSRGEPIVRPDPPQEGTPTSHSLLSLPRRTPPMATIMYVPMKTARPPGQCCMLTTVPLALPALMAAPHPVSPTPVAMPSSIRTAGLPPLTMSLSLHPLALLPQLVLTQQASCPTRTMRSSTPIPSLGQLGIPPTDWATPRPHLPAWSGPHTRHMTPSASMPQPLDSPTLPSIRTTASDSSSACRLTCRDRSLAGASLRGRGEGFHSCSLIFRGVARCSFQPSSSRCGRWGAGLPETPRPEDGALRMPQPPGPALPSSSGGCVSSDLHSCLTPAWGQGK